ncbi:MAG TPA: ATP-binding protein [Polyangiales bacterium]|nr:ATP-binding protein [Polyangiales bacterium]
MSALYPWCAVVGQEPLKQALLLCAIDPAIGGVLVHGPRGVAKTTLARALSELVTGRFVELPLGATEERVAGTLDLEAALREGRAQFSPGLLARAHEGVLYVDEVNLLPDGLVDLLLDAAASGQNVVERDGVSHAHPARFVLIGSMNPEEGELRPQLIDRFGLAAGAGGEIVPSERALIVQRRIEFDRDPAAFRQRFAAEQRELLERCNQARARTASIPLAGPALEYVGELCHRAGVEGVRADLAMLRAARARAAWQGRAQIEREDVDAVAELALSHRRPKRSAADSGGGSPSGAAGGGFTPASGGSGSREPERRAVPVRAAPPPRLPSSLLPVRGRAASRSRRGRANLAEGRGSIDWFATLLRRRQPGRDQLRYRPRRRPRAQHWVIAIDCSSSMLQTTALAAAKGLASALEREARRSGAHVSLISFRGRDARIEVSSSAGRAVLTQAITALGGGGATPLRAALDSAFTLARRARTTTPGLHRRLILLSDARSRDDLGGLARREPDLERIVIDCERGPVRLRRACQLAKALGAAYLHLDDLSATESPG